jgi:hypothetical protein
LIHVTNVLAEGLTIRAPGDSPNTDGIHISSANVKLRNINIGTGGSYSPQHFKIVGTIVSKIKDLTLAVQEMIVLVFWKALPILPLNRLLADQVMESGEIV